MNQRIAARAIVQIDQKTLLLRRAKGRSSIMGKFELPGGKLEYGEQPEDALARYLQVDADLILKTAHLLDVLTYIDHDDRDIQYVFILYTVSLKEDHLKVRLSENYDRFLWEKMQNIQQDTLTESAKLLLGISQQEVQSIDSTPLIDTDVKKSTDITKVLVYSDGGSRGNPGPSAAGFVVMNVQEHVIHEGGVYLGIATNNIAEYQGVRLGLEKALELGAREVEFYIDSMLVVNQMKGVYTIKNRELWPIHERILELMSQFDRVTFAHVKREYNQLADGMVNKILNAHGLK
jgi:ribonuclease HI/ADP-ribose pyrophosphatase YjhB (NUDIX family)